MKDGQRLIVKVIKSEEDLPKEDGRYSAHLKTDSLEYEYKQRAFTNSYKEFWLSNIDWYLIPEPEITLADIEAWAEQGIYGDKTHKNAWLQGRIEGAKAMRDNEIRHIK